MKKIFRTAAMLMVSAIATSACCSNAGGEGACNQAKDSAKCCAAAPATYEIAASTTDSIALLPPSDLNGVTLAQALKNRRTVRSFDAEKQLTDQQVSDLLWCALGKNREDGKRTAPTARNAQEIELYLYTKAAIYRYQAASHSLKLVKAGNFVEKAGKGGFYLIAPMALTIVADFDKMADFDEEGKQFYSATDAGFVSQNIYLYAAAEGLATVTCGSIDRPAIVEMLGLPNAKAILSHPIGYEAAE